MYRQGCLLQQQQHTKVSQLLPRVAAHGSSRCSSRCRALLGYNSSSSSSSSRQQPLRSSGIPPAATPTQQQQQQQQQQRQQWQPAPQQQQQPQQPRRVATAAAQIVWPKLSQRSRSKYVNELNNEHGVPGFFEFYLSAVSGQPVLYIMHPRGHTLEVQLQGATITRWLKPDGEDLLHLRSDAVMEPGEPINSGIPLAFPQWRDGLLPYNGFADKLEWDVYITEFDGEPVNQIIPPEAWEEGQLQLAVDADGTCTAPRPDNILDDVDVRGEWTDEALAQQLKQLESVAREEEQQQAAATAAAAAAAAKKSKAKKGRKGKQTDTADPQQQQQQEPQAVQQDAAAAALTQQVEQAPEIEQGPPVVAQSAAAAAPPATAPAPAAAAAAAKDDQAGVEEEDEEEQQFDYGIVEDLAPYVVLHLTDTEETRAIWPHKFELYYKITLMETDEYPDPREGLPRGIFDADNGADVSAAGPEYSALREMVLGDDPELAQAAAVELAERYRASNIRSGVGLDGIASQAEGEMLQPLPGQQLSTGYRLFTDEDGTLVDEEAIEDAEEWAEEAARAGLRGPGGLGKGKGRKKKAATDADAATAAGEEEEGGAEDASAAAAAAGDVAGEEGASSAALAAQGSSAAAAAAGGGQQQQQQEAEGEEGDDGDVDLPPGYYQTEDPPMQIKLEWVLMNKDPEGSPPMQFQLGALTHFKTEDQSRHGEFVRVLGLGGSMAYDWSQDSRRKRLVATNTDYVTFDGANHDAVHINTDEADVMFCPGSRTHFELLQREGVPDVVVWHPGARGVPGLEVEPRFFAQVGAGRLALPKTLSPGEEWRGEYVIRHHDKYWEPPVFDRDAPQPLPKLVTQRDDADDREDIDDGYVVEGVLGSRLGGGAHVPNSDE